MVTTRMTEALPITIPSAVNRDRTLFALRARTLNRKASPSCMRSSAGAGLFQELLGLTAGGIVGRERQIQIPDQEFPRSIQVALGLDVGLGALEHQLGVV